MKKNEQRANQPPSAENDDLVQLVQQIMARQALKPDELKAKQARLLKILERNHASARSKG